MVSEHPVTHGPSHTPRRYDNTHNDRYENKAIINWTATVGQQQPKIIDTFITNIYITIKALSLAKNTALRRSVRFGESSNIMLFDFFS